MWHQDHDQAHYQQADGPRQIRPRPQQQHQQPQRHINPPPLMSINPASKSYSTFLKFPRCLIKLYYVVNELIVSFGTDPSDDVCQCAQRLLGGSLRLWATGFAITTETQRRRGRPSSVQQASSAATLPTAARVPLPASARTSIKSGESHVYLPSSTHQPPTGISVWNAASSLSATATTEDEDSSPTSAGSSTPASASTSVARAASKLPSSSSSTVATRIHTRPTSSSGSTVR